MPPTAVLGLCLGAVLATAAECGRSADRPSPAPASASTPVTAAQLTHLLTQHTSAYRTETQSVARDAASWRELWQQLHGGAAGAPPLPAVDFAREMVVLVALGERSTGGYEVRVDEVAPRAGGAVVRYTITVPGPECMTSQALTSPVDVVRAPLATGEVRFEPRTVPSSC